MELRQFFSNTDLYPINIFKISFMIILVILLDNLSETESAVQLGRMKQVNKAYLTKSSLA
jgi:hypothetical protein